MRKPRPTGGCWAKKRKEEINAFILEE